MYVYILSVCVCVCVFPIYICYIYIYIYILYVDVCVCGYVYVWYILGTNGRLEPNITASASTLCKNAPWSERGVRALIFCASEERRRVWGGGAYCERERLIEPASETERGRERKRDRARERERERERRLW